MDVAVLGNVAYLADGTAGLRVVTMDAGPPFTLDCNAGALALTGSARGVFVSGSLAYVAAESAGLHAVDVSIPASPALVDSFDTTGRAYAVAVSGTAALVADDSGGLRVVDVSAEPAPVIVGHADTAGNAEAVAVAGATAYVADGDGGLRAFDTTEVTAPVELWACADSLEAMDVALQGDYGYVADSAGELRVLDVASPSAPVCDVGSCAVAGNPNGVVVDGTSAYVAAGEAGLAIVDIANPAVPSVLDTVDTPGSANGVAVAGGYAYVADGASGLQIVDISSPTGAAVVGSAETSGYCWEVALADGYAFVASGDAGLEVFDVANPLLPAPVAALALSGSAHGVALRENYAFVSVGGRGLVVVEVTDPENPAFVTSCGTPSVPGPSDLAIAGGYAYVADAESGLVVVDIISPYVALAALESPAMGQRLALTEPADGSGVAYIAAGQAGLQIVQVPDSEEATNPSLVRTNRTLGEVTDVALHETSGGTAYGYVTDASGRLSVMNIANPVNPYTVGSLVTSGSALAVASAQVGLSSYALVAGGYEGLSTVRTSVVSSPTEQSVADTPGWCSDVAATTLADDPFALVADGDAGLRLLDLSPVGTQPVTVFSEGFESSLSGWTQSGTVEWYTGTPRRGTHAVALRGDGSISRTISTVGYGRISVTFHLGAWVSADGEYVLAEWSDGAGWYELARIENGDTAEDRALYYYSVELASSADDNASFALRFSVSGDASDDYGYVDDITVLSESSSQPNEVAFYNTPGQASGVTAAESGVHDYALVADGEAGLRIIDVSSPGSPTEVGHYDTAGYAESVTSYGGNIAAVADGGNGLVLVNFTSPTAPFEIAHYDTPGWATDAQVLNGHTWVADSGWGLTILQLWYTFRDVLFGNWAFLEIEDITSLDNAIGNRITTGYPDGKYHPEITCTRDQMCVFIARAMNWVQWDETMTLDEALFLDVPAGHWAGRAIHACGGNNPDGIVVVFGYADNFFRPTAVVQRDSMCVFIARANEWVDPYDLMNTAPEIFPDVWAEYWCGTAIQACLEHGVVKGYPDGLYRPWLAVSRDQMAVFIWRAFLQ
jgi:hypothetical protein